MRTSDDLTTPPRGTTSHDPADLYGAHAVGTPSTVLAPIRPDLPSGRRRAGIFAQAVRTLRGTL